MIKMDSKKGSSVIGIKFGLTAAIVYILCLYIKFRLFDASLMSFSLAATAGYIFFIILCVIAALTRKKQLGGYIDIKDLFQTIFLVIIIAECFYAAFNYIYLTYVDPAFFDRLADNTRKWGAQTGRANEQLEELVKSIKAQKGTTIGAVLLGLARSVVLDAIIGIIIAFALKKPQQVSEADLDRKPNL